MRSESAGGLTGSLRCKVEGWGGEVECVRPVRGHCRDLGKSWWGQHSAVALGMGRRLCKTSLGNSYLETPDPSAHCCGAYKENESDLICREHILDLQTWNWQRWLLSIKTSEWAGQGYHRVAFYALEHCHIVHSISVFSFFIFLSPLTLSIFHLCLYLNLTSFSQASCAHQARTIAETRSRVIVIHPSNKEV